MPRAAEEELYKVLAYNSTEEGQRTRTLAMGFSVTCLPLDEVEGVHLNMEANHMLETNVSVDDCGPSKQMMTQLDEGMNQPHGWILYARNVNDKAASNGVSKDAMVGVMVVSATASNWDRPSSRGGASCTIWVLGVHDRFRRRGVAPEMWTELLQAIKKDSVTGRGPFELTVQGAKCLNSSEARRFYDKRGFAVANDDQNLFASLEFLDGEPVSRRAT